jgi:uncharacterized membrane protein YphA (DoxX/SURF4 family)
MAWLLTASIAIAAAWSWFDRSRADRLRVWFRLFLRLALAAQMFYYGMAKVIPSQFPPPGLVTLIEPVGASSLSDLLWTFVGASLPYQITAGCAEVLAGVLLMTPATATAGAALALIDMLHVFVLNMTYDFGLKQISFHLLVMAGVILAPDARRLAAVFLGRAAAAAAPRTRRCSARPARTASRSSRRWHSACTSWPCSRRSACATGMARVEAARRGRRCSASGTSRSSRWTARCAPLRSTITTAGGGA